MRTSLNKRLFSFYQAEVTDFFANCRPLLKNGFVTVLVRPVVGDGQGKLLVIAGAKVGNACVRNALRRRCKALFVQAQLYKNQKSLIFIFRPGIARFFAVKRDFSKKLALLFVSVAAKMRFPAA